MKKIICIAVMLAILPSLAFAGDLQYNAFENKWEFAQPDETLQYNAFENEWSYEKPDSTLDYNAFENEWQWNESESD